MIAQPSSSRQLDESSNTANSAHLVIDGFAIKSWCPSSVDQILQHFSPGAADFLFSLPRKPAPLRDHSQCTTRNCIANSTSDDDYQSSHWGKCSQNCKFQGPNVDQIIDIIREGGIPLISLRRAIDGAVVIKVIRATAKLKFFAVSHVWSGGLGNPAENTLPLCQLLRLYDVGTVFHRQTKGWWLGDFLNSGKSECLFWMDTLCIPVGKDSVCRSLRARAINSMAQIYAKARGIIILDHELQQLPFDQNCLATNLGHLICSAWMSRCWTFQEGALANEWFIQFEDGLYSIDKQCSEVQDTSQLVEWSAEIKWFYEQLPRLKEIEGQKTFVDNLCIEDVHLFRLVWNNLSIRHTTKCEDLISIISILLGFRPRDVNSLEADNRLLSIFNSQRVLPIAFLFRKRPVILNWNNANRWLPLTVENHPIEDFGGSMWRRSPDENFFVFQPPKNSNFDTTVPKFFFSHSEANITETMSLIHPESHRRLTVRVQLSPLLFTPMLNLCVVMGDLWGNSENDYTSHGALLGIRERTPEYVRFFYLCPVELVFVNIFDSCLQEECSAQPNTVLYHKELDAEIEYVFEHGISIAISQS